MRKILVPVVLCILSFLVGCVPDKFKFESEFGKVGSKPGEFSNAVDMEMTPEEDLIVSDAGNNRFQVITSDGAYKFSGAEYGTTGFKVQSIGGCGVNVLTGEILLCDVKGNKIVKYSKTGQALSKITDKVRGPLDAAFDKSGNIYVIMAKQANISIYNSAGKFLKTIGGTGNTALQFPISIKIRDENVFIADSSARRVVKMKTSGEFVEQYTSKGDVEPMKGPTSVHVDSSGDVYILDVGDVPVVMLGPDGKLISKIGGFGDEPGKFMYPKSIVAKENGEVLILDNNRNLVIKYKKLSN